MYEAKVTVTTKGRKNDLPVNSGDNISIIRTTNCPKGKWLARDSSNNCEFMLSLAMGSLQEYNDTLRWKSISFMKSFLRSFLELHSKTRLQHSPKQLKELGTCFKT